MLSVHFQSVLTRGQYDVRVSPAEICVHGAADYKDTTAACDYIFMWHLGWRKQYAGVLDSAR